MSPQVIAHGDVASCAQSRDVQGWQLFAGNVHTCSGSQVSHANTSVMMYGPLNRFLVFSALLLLVACKEDPVGPAVGSGTELKATVNGQSYSFPLNSVSPPSYVASTKTGTFTGVITGSPSRTLTITFTYDIDNGAMPVTLSNPDVSIIYSEVSGSTTASYSCPIGASGCSVTLTATNKTTVDGTFNANLADPNDTLKTVSITGGTFSIKLNR